MAASVPSTSSEAFINVSLSSANLFVLHQLIPAYKASSPWSSFGTISNIDVQQNGFYYYFDTPKEEATILGVATIPSGNLNIPSYVVYEGVDYDVIAIGGNVFKGRSGLTSVTIPNSVTSIGNGAFQNCRGLTALSIGKNIKFIGQSAFNGCSGLNTITVASGNTVYDSRNNCNAIIEKATGKLIQGCNTTVVPDGVTSIGDNAFLNCSGLTSVTIPNSVTSIGQLAFNNCSSLTSITINSGALVSANRSLSGYFGKQVKEYLIGNSVTSIGDNAFYNCSGLTSVQVSDLAAWCNINFSNNESNPLYYAHHLYLNNTEVKNLSIPNSVNTIRSYAFYGCSGLTFVTIPNSVTYIGDEAFYGCSGLTSVNINNNVVVSADRTENDNLNSIFGSQVKEYIVGNDVTAIGQNAFWGNTNLTTVSVGKNIGSIGDNAFYGCSNMATFTCYATDIPAANSTVFEGIDLTNSTLYVPASSLEEYEETKPWRRFGSILPLEDEGITTPIKSIATNSVDQKGFFIYDMNGRKTTNSQCGILIIKDRNGKTRKVVVK